MKTLFNKADHEAMRKRICNIPADAKREWGKMEPAQMLAHCSEALRMAVGDKVLKRAFIGRVLGPFFKKDFLSEKPFSKNGPTGPSFVITDSRDLEKERAILLELLDRFHKGGEPGATKHPHGFFGKLTPKQWGEVQWKHLDHHLRQFGA